MKPAISIIVCTHNRCASLRSTLGALAGVQLPPHCAVELLLVDNGSTDDTRKIAHTIDLPTIRFRYFSEPRAGKSRAQNVGLANAVGELIVFTDDDVIPCREWLHQLSVPLLEGKCDAAAGGIQLAPELSRDWMHESHRRRLAAPTPDKSAAVELIGANMAFHRRVLERVPAFDPELGPGALGFDDDTLFSMQLTEAGFRLASVPDARVVHHPDPRRLLRAEWIRGARNKGRSDAYVAHHWYHRDFRNPRLKALYLSAKLRLRGKIQLQPAMDSEGCARWEISYVGDIAFCRQFLYESKRSRNYLKRGLRHTALRSPSQASAQAPVPIASRVYAA